MAKNKKNQTVDSNDLQIANKERVDILRKISGLSGSEPFKGFDAQQRSKVLEENEVEVELEADKDLGKTSDSDSKK